MKQMGLAVMETVVTCDRPLVVVANRLRDKDEFAYTYLPKRRGAARRVRFGPGFEFHWMGGADIAATYTDRRAQHRIIYTNGLLRFSLSEVRSFADFALVMLRVAACAGLDVMFTHSLTNPGPTAVFSAPL